MHIMFTVCLVILQTVPFMPQRFCIIRRFQTNCGLIEITIEGRAIVATAIMEAIIYVKLNQNKTKLLSQQTPGPIMLSGLVISTFEKCLGTTDVQNDSKFSTGYPTTFLFKPSACYALCFWLLVSVIIACNPVVLSFCDSLGHTFLLPVSNWSKIYQKKLMQLKPV